MLTCEGLSLVADHAAVDSVAKKVIEGAAAERMATANDAMPCFPLLARYVASTDVLPVFSSSVRESFPAES